MFPVLGAAAAGLTLASGFMQAGAIRKQADEQMRRLRLRGQQVGGQLVAGAAGSGVEVTSSTVQNALRRITSEYQRQISMVGDAADTAATGQIVGAFGSAAGTFSQSLYNASKVTSAIGEAPAALAPSTSSVSMVAPQPFGEDLSPWKYGFGGPRGIG